ncbi:type I DNA topoisomerase [Candidatus Fermentibacteria bacterium]|nr:type I DNA topoisomerase [Candidatus Fermentibacteria bacterium]
MPKSLVIVESPAKAKTIGGFLGTGFQVVASMGHVRDLPPRSLGVDPDAGFTPEYEIIAGKSKVVREIRDAARSAVAIYLAADQDREGEAISWHVKSLLPQDDRPVWRVLFNEITKTAIQHAIQDPGLLDMNKVDAQQARRVLDRLVGYKVSPYLWRTLKTNLSAGRVQSVALRLVCEREEEILSFKPEEYWVIKAHLKDASGAAFDATLATKGGKKIRVECAEEASRTCAELEQQRFAVGSVATVQRFSKTPAPFITSSLQQEASNRLGFAPERTMRVAQELYEGLEVAGEGHVGLITYMRTDSFRIAKEAQDEARSLIRDRWGDAFVPAKPPFYGSRKRAQDAHEAIRPTGVRREPGEMARHLGRDQARLYELIWRRFVGSQMAAEKVEVTTVMVDAGPYGLRANGLRRLFPGHTAVWPSAKDEQELPVLKEGQEVTLQRIDRTQQFTKPRPRFTEASLIKELESKGIGRPSTYASIVSTLRRRNYVVREDKCLVPTELGKAVNTILVGGFPDLFAVGFTAQLEDQLDKVERGEASWVSVVSDFYEAFKGQLSAAERSSSELRRLTQRDSGQTCPECGKPLLIKMGRHGEFLACSGFPACRHAGPLKKDAETAPQVVQGECPRCGAPMVMRSGRFGEFLACSTYPTCKGTRPLTTGVPCPKEGCTGEISSKRSKGGKRFYGCSRYPQCDFVTWAEPVAVLCPHCGAPAAGKRVRGSKESLKCLRCGKAVKEG